MVIVKTIFCYSAAEGFELILAADVIRFQADDNYTYLFLKNGTKIVACHTLKEIKEQLQGFLFLSVSIIHG
jgi:two-component system LytT family response regulator